MYKKSIIALAMSIVIGCICPDMSYGEKQVYRFDSLEGELDYGIGIFVVTKINGKRSTIYLGETPDEHNIDIRRTLNKKGKDQVLIHNVTCRSTSIDTSGNGSGGRRIPWDYGSPTATYTAVDDKQPAFVYMLAKHSDPAESGDSAYEADLVEFYGTELARPEPIETFEVEIPGILFTVKEEGMYFYYLREHDGNVIFVGEHINFVIDNNNDELQAELEHHAALIKGVLDVYLNEDGSKSFGMSDKHRISIYSNLNDANQVVTNSAGIDAIRNLLSKDYNISSIDY